MEKTKAGFDDLFLDMLTRVNDQMNSLYSQLNRQQEEVLPEYLTLLNCNVITNVFRTITDRKPDGITFEPGLDPGSITRQRSNIKDFIGDFQPKITVEFSEPGPPLILNYNIYPAFTGAENSNVIEETLEKAALFWNVDLSEDGLYNMTMQQWWTNLGIAQTKAGKILENDLMHAMMNARNGNQSVVDFIPKQGIFLSVPINSTSALTTPGGTGAPMDEFGPEGPIPADPHEEFPHHELEGPGGGDFGEEIIEHHHEMPPGHSEG